MSVQAATFPHALHDELDGQMFHQPQVKLQSIPIVPPLARIDLRGWRRATVPGLGPPAPD